MDKFMFPIKCKATLALGADITNSICFAKGNECFVSESVNDLSLLDNFEKFKKNVDGFLKRFGTPETIVVDKHPSYASSKYGEQLASKFNVKLVRMQHHKAHIAAAALENGLKNYVGIACDGLGYGDDGNIWGGEIFDVNDNRFERIGSLEEQPQLGGDSATIYPKKMLFGILSKFMDKDELSKFYSEDEIKLYLNQLEQGYNVFTTTSTGRILDAVSALLGVCDKRTYEGEPAIRLERFASKEYFDIDLKIEGNKLNTTELFKFLIKNFNKDKKKLAATAHIYLARGLLEIAKKYNKPIVFSGGVAFNKIIADYLKENGVLLHKKIQPGDACIAVGQAYIANN